MADAEQKSGAEKEPGQKKRKLSIGEKVFDVSVYGVVNYLGTLILTVPIAHALQYGVGKNTFDSIAGRLPSEGVGGKLSRALLMATTTMQGGNVMLLPVKWAESHKVGFVNKVNKAFGDKTDPSEIQEVPKQTWGSLIGGRILAWTTVFGSMFGADFVVGKQFAAYEQWFGRKTSQIMKKAPYEGLPKKMIHAHGALKGKIAEATLRGESTAKLEKGLAKLGKKIAQFETEPFHYGRIISIDIFATAAATALLFIGSRFFANHNAKKKQQGEHAAPTDVKLPEGMPTPSTVTNAPAKDDDRPRTTVTAGEVAAQRAMAGDAPGVTLA